VIFKQVLNLLHMYKYITVIVQQFIKGWNFIPRTNKRKSNVMKCYYRKKHIYKCALNYSKGDINSFKILFFNFLPSVLRREKIILYPNINTHC